MYKMGVVLCRLTCDGCVNATGEYKIKHCNILNEHCYPIPIRKQCPFYKEFDEVKRDLKYCYERIKHDEYYSFFFKDFNGYLKYLSDVTQDNYFLQFKDGE